MSWFRKYPAFATPLLVLSLVVLAEAWCLHGRRAAARTAWNRLDHARRELRAVTDTQPMPTPENAVQIEADLARVSRTLAALQAELREHGPVAERLSSAKVPEQRPDAFFDIAAFVEAMRDRAQRAGVALKPDERFSFSSYANEVPESGRIAAVFRERLIVQHLLEALMEARPHQLLSVQRERPLATTGGSAAANAGGAPAGRPSGAGSADYFDLDPRVSARVPGLVEATALRVSFTGHTVVLRGLLNRLADFELPLVVRAVEVAPADAVTGGSTPVQPGATPLIARPLSRFTVTVEFIRLAPTPVTAS